MKQKYEPLTQYTCPNCRYLLRVSGTIKIENTYSLKLKGKKKLKSKKYKVYYCDRCGYRTV